MSSSRIKNDFMLIIAVPMAVMIVVRVTSRPSQILALPFNLTDAAATFTAYIVRELDELEDIFLWKL